MKKKVLLLTLFLSFLFINVFSQTVYITNSGTKYHTEGCRYLSKSQIAINLSDAIDKGFGACKVCSPPTTVTSTAKTKNQTEPTKKEPQKVSTSSNSKSTQSASVQCSATTKAGAQCKRMTKSSNGKCFQHGGI